MTTHLAGVLVAGLALAGVVSPAEAQTKRFVFIDSDDSDGYTTSAEGFFRSQDHPNQEIVYWWDWDALEDFSEVFIIARAVLVEIGEDWDGTPIYEWALRWGGHLHLGFGNGPDDFYVPWNMCACDVTFNFLVSHICFLWEMDQIINFVRPCCGGHEITGIGGIATAQVKLHLSGGNSQQLDEAVAALTSDRSFLGNPPANRPGATRNHLTAAQAILAEMGPVRVDSITYGPVYGNYRDPEAPDVIVTFEQDPDVVPPSCNLVSATAGVLRVRVQDEDSGLESIQVISQSNTNRPAGSFVEGFDAGWTEPFEFETHRTASRASVAFEVKDRAGNATVCDPVMVTMTGETPETFFLSQNYPNPFNPTTRIEFGLPESGAVRLVLFDVRGRVMEVLAEGHYAAGSYTLTLDTADLPSGTYYYRLEAGRYVASRPLTVLR